MGWSRNVALYLVVSIEKGTATSTRYVVPCMYVRRCMSSVLASASRISCPEMSVLGCKNDCLYRIPGM